MSKCESLDGQCGKSWCNCDEIRARRPRANWLHRLVTAIRWCESMCYFHAVVIAADCAYLFVSSDRACWWLAEALFHWKKARDLYRSKRRS